ncbi:MAG: hypothetical protein KDC98_14335 [Planctomycetes bacterium]|nr:hypothetical protein [Planctomycetota bacterium]
MPRSSSFALVQAFLAVAIGAQGGTPVPSPGQIPSSTLLSRLQSTQTSLDTARDVAYELADRKIADRIQLFELITRRYQDALQQAQKARDKFRRRAADLVPQVQREQLGKGGAAEVKLLQDQAAQITRAPDLSKQRIHSDLDPLLQRLRELVLVAPDDLLAADDELTIALDEMAEQRDTLQGWFDLYLDTRRGLGLGDDPTGKRHVEKHKPPPDPPPYDIAEEDLAAVCLMALPMSAHDHRTLAANEDLRDSTAAEEFLGTLALNEIRIALGLGTLRIDPKLGDAARDHSSDMDRLGFFSHTSPVDGKRTPGERAARFGTSAGAENIAAGQSTGSGAIQAWWYSPGHHKNMLGGHARTGLGQCGDKWTQMFGG